jgi:crotonobetainyl-CoA:carnitine CoA-transferase CaiB-like acyl-CoA transferase
MPFLKKSYRLLDLAWFGPGPFCARLLGDLGFDVIKIVEVAAGAGRRGGRRFEVPQIFHEPTPAARPLGIRNARSIALNLKSERGLAVFQRLVQGADALQEGFRPGVARRLGIDYDSVKAIRPDIVYASITGYGQDGPYAQKPGHDLNYLSIAGFIDMNGRAGGPPAIPGTVIADYAAGGMSAAVHILAALLRREATGQGAYCDISMTDAAFEINSILVDNYLASGLEPRRGQTLTSGFWPWYDVYETKDGKYISLACVEPWFYDALCKAIGREDLLGGQWDLERREQTKREFRDLFKSQTRDYWVTVFANADVCFAPVNSIAEAVEDPQLRARGMVREVEHPVHGRARALGSMLKLDGQQVEYRHWITEPGQHTTEVLLEAGFAEKEIDELRAAGDIG